MVNLCNCRIMPAKQHSGTVVNHGNVGELYNGYNYGILWNTIVLPWYPMVLPQFTMVLFITFITLHHSYKQTMVSCRFQVEKHGNIMVYLEIPWQIDKLWYLPWYYWCIVQFITDIVVTMSKVPWIYYTSSWFYINYGKCDQFVVHHGNLMLVPQYTL